MIIQEVMTKYTLFKDGAEYVLVARRNREVFRGTETECREFAERHPYGITRRERI